jgi:hypothetical protein
MTSYLESVVGEQAQEAQVEIQAITQRITDMEQAVRAEFDRIVDDLVTPYENEIRLIEDITDIVGNVAQIVNAARVALCVASCGLPPGLGCIWGCLGQIVGEVIVNAAVQSCWFQREFLFPIINGSQFIRNLPTTIARLIHEQLQQAVPVGVRPLLGNIAALGPTRTTEADLDCDASIPPPEPTTRRELEGLAARHGSDRVGALIGLLIYLGAVRPSAGTSPGLAAALDRFLSENPNFTAADFTRLMRELPGRFPGSSTIEAEFDVIRSTLRREPARVPAQERTRRPDAEIFRQGPRSQSPPPQGDVRVLEF